MLTPSFHLVSQTQEDENGVYTDPASVPGAESSSVPSLLAYAAPQPQGNGVATNGLGGTAGRASGRRSDVDDSAQDEDVGEHLHVSGDSGDVNDSALEWGGSDRDGSSLVGSGVDAHVLSGSGGQRPQSYHTLNSHSDLDSARNGHTGAWGACLGGVHAMSCWKLSWNALLKRADNALPSQEHVHANKMQPVSDPHENLCPCLTVPSVPFTP